MSIHSLQSNARRVVVVLLTLLLVQSLSVVPARAVDPVPWTGSFTSASATDPTPALESGTSVDFSVNNTLGWAEIKVFYGSGEFARSCSTGTVCSVWSNPAPGTSQTYYAELWVQRANAFVKYATSSSVTVTDPGWTGSFTGAYTDDPTPALDSRAVVSFSVSNALDAAEIRVFDSRGTKVASCSSGTVCGVLSDPAPGASLTYHAEVWVQRADAFVKYATSSSVTVTDPGWTGTIAPSASNAAFVDPGESTTISFDVSKPLDVAGVEIYVDGVYKSSCYSVGQTSCGISVQFPDGPPHVVKAVVRAQRAGGWGDISSASVVVSTQSPEQLADWLLDPDVDHGDLTYLPVSAALAGLSTRVASEEFCLAVGQALPTYGYGSTAPDLTLDCTAGALTVGQVFAYAMRVAGVIGAIEVVNAVASSTSPTPSTVAGGGRAENMPNVEDHTGCSNFDFAGNCLDPWKLTSLSREHVAFTPAPAEYWRGSTVLCTATYVDPDTGEEQVFELRTDGLKHILEEHAATPGDGKSIWDSDRFFTGLDAEVLANFQRDLLPEDFDRIVQFICTSLAYVDPTSVDPSSVPGSLNTVRTYTDPKEPVGKNPEGARDSNYTLVITPAGEVWTAHPGLPN